MIAPVTATTTAPDLRLDLDPSFPLALRETRLAATFVGGTSLAIYENGVAQEFFKLVHGIGMYGVIKRLTHSHAYVDFLTGTSAGGINSVFLAAALTHGSNLDFTRDVWTRLASLDDFLQKPGARDVPSLFRDDYYMDALRDVFRCMPEEKQAQGDLLPSGFDTAGNYTDLDLFVTGTYYAGLPRTYSDGRGSLLCSSEHRGLFHLKHRETSTHLIPTLPDPQPACAAANRTDLLVERLARIARTTSSLPAVFVPSEVKKELMEGILEFSRARTPSTWSMAAT